MALPRLHGAKLAAIAFVWLAPAAAQDPPEALVQALQRVSPASLKGHVAFLASDLLQGRATPSPGLDIAAEYIATQWMRARLDPVPGTGGYFQTANWIERRLEPEKFRAVVEIGGETFSFSSQQLAVLHLTPAKLVRLPIYRSTAASLEAVQGIPAGSLKGFVLVLPWSFALMRRATALQEAAMRAGAEAVVLVRREGTNDRPGRAKLLIDPAAAPRCTAVVVYSAELANRLEALPEGETAARFTLEGPALEDQPVRLHNVVGVLPGSDPALKDTYVLLTAHYDHVGVGADEAGDAIYNGANDDASGTAALIEVASVLGAMKERPRRSIVFVAFFGEELGLLGSRYYVRNPIFPLAQTIANLNLEHMGRTDSTEGPQLNRLSVTGFEYSDIPQTLASAGKLTSVEIFHHASNSEAFFTRSDNATFARVGIPAHTVCVSFLFADYHRPGDHWQKIDYENLARVTRTVAASAWLLADRREQPAWNASHPQTASFRSARDQAAEQKGPAPSSQ